MTLSGPLFSAVLVLLAAGGFYLFYLKKELNRQRQALAKVFSVQKSVIELDLSSEKIMQEIASQTMLLSGADGASIEIVSGDELIYRCAEGALKNYLGFRIGIASSLAGLSLTKDEFLIADDTETDNRVDRDACRKTKIRSMIVFPMKHRGKMLGVLKASSSLPHTFNQEHAKLLQFMAGLLSTSLSQAYQIEEKSSLVTMLQSDEIRLTHLKNRAEENARVKTELLASMSHEIRGPLNAILALTRLLAGSSHRSKQMEYIGGIHSSGKLLQMLMNNLLDFSSIESGKVEIESVVFDLEDLISTIKKAFIYQAQQKGIELKVILDGDVGTNVVGDPARLGQVLMNLVGNAVKFTMQGQVTIHGQRVIDDGESKVLFVITDTGIGIKESALKQLFQSFQQADASISRKFGGSGLGLSISKKLVELMNGEIAVESQQGVGSVFSFTIDLPETQKEITTQEIVKESRPTGDFKILVVEDNHINQMVMVDMLDQLGFSADTVTTGKEAIAALRTQPYDLLLMDCQMPEMSGYEATALIRRDSEASFNQIPIVAVTGNVFPGDRENCMAVGMNDYIAKPIEVNDLERVLGRWLPRKDRPAVTAVAAPEDGLENSKHIDIHRFKVITGSFGPEKFNRISELIRVYLSSMAEYIELAENAFENQDAERVGRKAHSIKSSSENIGAKALGKIASEIELRCREQPGSIHRDQFESLKQEFGRVKMDLNKLLSIIDRNRISQVQKSNYNVSS